MRLTRWRGREAGKGLHYAALPLNLPVVVRTCNLHACVGKAEYEAIPDAKTRLDFRPLLGFSAHRLLPLVLVKVDRLK